MRYECDKCGACWKQLLVEIYDIDVLREPKLITSGISDWTREMTQSQLMYELEQEGKCLVIAGPAKPCQFLGEENRCEIYPTRPNVCVAMQAGDEQCRQTREAAGVDPLPPTGARDSVRNLRFRSYVLKYRKTPQKTAFQNLRESRFYIHIAIGLVHE